MAETSFDYKWMHLFPYAEDDSAQLKRRSSGGPELFAAAKEKISSSSSCAYTSFSPLLQSFQGAFIVGELTNESPMPASCGVWDGRRRGSLPVDVYRASGSCSSESESSGMF